MVKIGYQGDIGSNNNNNAFDEFVKRNLIKDAEGIPLITSQNVVNALNGNQVNYGVMALRNIISGTVVETELVLKNLKYKIIDQLELPIKHSLSINRKSNLVDILNICSHPQALAQCNIWINLNLPLVNILNYIDTAKAARDLEKGILDEKTAVICSPLAASIYNLKVVEENISNLSNNFTTFILIKLIR